MNHYTYMILIKPDFNSKVFYYVGLRSSLSEPEDDFYMSSSKLVRSFELAGVEVRKIILGKFETRLSASREEQCLIKTMINDDWNLNLSKNKTKTKTFELLKNNFKNWEEIREMYFVCD